MISVKVCPVQCLGYMYTKKVFIVFLKFKLIECPLFLFAKSGNPPLSKCMHTKLPLVLIQHRDPHWDFSE